MLTGDSTEVEFAASTNESLMMFTVNCLVLKILSRVSFGLRFDMAKETLTIGGL
jgi:hypothetical protein